MSLVNDVLRQIDYKSYSNDGIKAALPLSLQQNSSVWDKPRVVLLSLTALILVVYILQRLIIGYFNDERSQALDPSYAVDSTYNVIAKDEIFAINADVNSTKDSDDSQNIRQSQPKDATVFIAATPVAKASVPASIPVSASIPVPKLISTQDVKPQKIASQKKMGVMLTNVTYIKKQFLSIPYKTLYKYRETYYGEVKDCEECKLAR
mgnify:CR=1 FL=1